MKIFEGNVVKIRGCKTVHRVSGPFYVTGGDVEAASCALGVAILQTRHNQGPYHSMAVNLSRGVQFYHDYTILLKEVGKARPGVFSCC